MRLLIILFLIFQGNIKVYALELAAMDDISMEVLELHGPIDQDMSIIEIPPPSRVPREITPQNTPSNQQGEFASPEHPHADVFENDIELGEQGIGHPDFSDPMEAELLGVPPPTEFGSVPELLPMPELVTPDSGQSFFPGDEIPPEVIVEPNDTIINDPILDDPAFLPGVEPDPNEWVFPEGNLPDPVLPVENDPSLLPPLEPVLEPVLEPPPEPPPIEPQIR